MRALPLPYFEEDDRNLLLRWGTASLFVLAAHIAAVAGCLLLNFSGPPAAEGVPVVLIDLSATPSAPQTPPTDVAPGPEMTQAQEKLKQPDQVREALPAAPDIATTVAPPKKPDVDEARSAPATTTAPHLEAPPGPALRAPAIGASNARPDLAESSWQGLLVAHLQKFKRYPKTAAANREEGVASVSFTINRSGRVLARSILKSSGFADLDQEALDMIQRAEPFPVFPPSMQAETRDFVLPIRFHLN
ncbi:MAG TPA: energy transducer TonB [Xanthobacteraceae bacterium]|nr:energy transducer TonB [Xanthobacteraceae bacterium]